MVALAHLRQEVGRIEGGHVSADTSFRVGRLTAGKVAEIHLNKAMSCMKLDSHTGQKQDGEGGG